jgi:uncharacterized protein (DUF1778 family)
MDRVARTDTAQSARDPGSLGAPESLGTMLPCLARQNAVQNFAGEHAMPSVGKKSTSPRREYKSERLELRLAPSAKRVIQQAMSVTGLAAGDLAYEGARRLLDEHQRMVLVGADRDAFLAALGRKPSAAPRLVEALKRHRRLFG